MQILDRNGSLYFEIVGDGPPILFIHGFPLSAEMWRATAEALQAEHTCILPDLRGHGRSDASETVTIQQFADDLAAVLDAIPETRPVAVCGLSMGGVIAFDLFRRHRDRVGALILTDCRADAESEEGRQTREQLAQNVLRDGSDFAADAMVARLFAPGASAELKNQWRQRISQTDPVGVAAASRALAQRPDSEPLLPRIDVPTLLVFGEEDTITPPTVGREMQLRIPNAQLEVIPESGHLPPVEQPARYVAALRNFLRTLTG